LNNFITYYQSPVGLLRITGSNLFINGVTFIDEQKATPLPPATEALPPMAIQALEQLIEYFNGSRRFFDFPIVQDGTEFQQKVWHELINIGYGKTISYLDLSRRLGDPKVIRAAAAANGKNDVAIIVPCHRVIGANGQLVGYAGGLWRKKWLLEHENKVANGVQLLF
jgi:methylated-DNA-[protein]-cysteine S-methyltransferase